MTPERALEILTSETISGYSHQPTEDERSEVIEVWDTLPGWTCFNDALIAIALPLIKGSKVSGYIQARAKTVKRAIAGKSFPKNFDFTP